MPNWSNYPVFWPLFSRLRHLHPRLRSARPPVAARPQIRRLCRLRRLPLQSTSLQSTNNSRPNTREPFISCPLRRLTTIISSNNSGNNKDNNNSLHQNSTFCQNRLCLRSFPPLLTSCLWMKSPSPIQAVQG